MKNATYAYKKGHREYYLCVSVSIVSVLHTTSSISTRSKIKGFYHKHLGVKAIFIIKLKTKSNYFHINYKPFT